MLTDPDGANSVDLESSLTEVTDDSSTSAGTEDKSSVDSLLNHLGQFGRFQQLLYFALWLPAASMAAGVYASVYMEYTPLYHCTNDTSLAYNEDDQQAQSCLDQRNLTCTAWSFDKSVFTRIVVSEFELVCEASYLKTLSTTVYMLGMLVGSFFFGWFGDRFGRKAAFLITTLCLSLGSVASAVSPNLWCYVAARFVTSCGGVGLFITCFVISMEFVGPKFRTICGVAIEIPFALGELYIVGLAYLIRDWRDYQLAIGLPFFLFILYLIKIPESVRWLLTKGRRDEAKSVLSNIARVNNVILPNVADDESTEETVEQVGMSNIFLQPTLRLRFLIMALNWIVATLGYYGLGLSSASLGSDAFSSFALSAAMEIPSYLFCVVFLDRCGRRGILSFSQILAGATCILAATLPFPAHLDYLRTGLVLLGKFGASASFAVVFVFTAELFPTPVRNTAIGLCSTSARLGGILSPYIASLSSSSPLLPFLVMGCCCCLGGLAAILLPETSGRPLPDTVEEAIHSTRTEDFYKKNLRNEELLHAFRSKSKDNLS